MENEEASLEKLTVHYNCVAIKLSYIEECIAKYGLDSYSRFEATDYGHVWHGNIKDRPSFDIEADNPNINWIGDFYIPESMSDTMLKPFLKPILGYEGKLFKDNHTMFNENDFSIGLEPFLEFFNKFNLHVEEYINKLGHEYLASDMYKGCLYFIQSMAGMEEYEMFWPRSEDPEKYKNIDYTANSNKPLGVFDFEYVLILSKCGS